MSSSRPHTHAGIRAPANWSHQSSKTSETSPEVVRAVRQMVGVAVSHLKTHPQSSCEEFLAQLPVTDDNFHW